MFSFFCKAGRCPAEAMRVLVPAVVSGNEPAVKPAASAAVVVAVGDASGDAAVDIKLCGFCRWS